MKRMITMFVLAATLIAASLSAQEPLKKFELKGKTLEAAKRNVLVGLRSQNNGVMESAMILIAKVKMALPQVQIAEIQALIDSLSITFPSESIRYKAHLASTICTDPQWFSVDRNVTTADAQTFFAEAGKRLQYKLFGISSL